VTLDLSALDVTLQAAGLDDVLAAFGAVDERGEATAAKNLGTIPFTTPGAVEAADAIENAIALLDAMGIGAKQAALSVDAVVVADRELANANSILARSGLEVEAITKAQAIAFAQEEVAADRAAAAMERASLASLRTPPPVRFRSGGVAPPEEPPGGGGGGAGDAAEEDAAVAETTSLYAGLAEQLLVLISVYEAYRAVRDAVVAGGEFDASIESARLGIAAITQAYGTLTDAQGDVLHGQDALTAAFGIADSILQGLQADAVRVAIPFQTLADLFRGIEGAALKAGASLDQIRQLVTSASLAATALGTPYEQLNTTLVQLLEGHVRITNQLVAHLGLTTQVVHEWQEQGTLIPNILATFEKFSGVGQEVQGTWRGISAEIKNAFDIITGTAIRPALTTLEEGLRDVLGQVIDASTGKVNSAFSGLLEYLGAGANIVARGLVEGFKDVVSLAEQISGWLDQHRSTVLGIVSGVAALVEAFGAVVKEVIGIVAPLEAAYITSGLILVPLKAVGYAIAIAVDGVHLFEAALSAVGYAIATLVLEPFNLLNKGLGEAANLIHHGLGDGLLDVSRKGEDELASMLDPAKRITAEMLNGGSAVAQFGKNWDEAQKSAIGAASAIEQAIAGAANSLATFHLTPEPNTGDGKDVAGRVQAAIESAKSAAALSKQYLDAALADNEVSYRDYFDELTRTEITSLDRQIAAKQELLASAKPAEQPKIEADITSLENQRQAVRLENERKYQQALTETNDKILHYIAEQEKAAGDEFTARLGEIGKEAEAYDQALAREGQSDAARRAALRQFVDTQTQSAEASDLERTIETQLSIVEQTRSLIHEQIKEHLISQADATQRLQALQSGNLAQITQELSQLEAIANLLKDPKLLNAVITLKLRLLNEDGKELSDMEQLENTFKNSVGRAIGDGVAQGFAAAFQTGSIAKGFAAFGDALLSGLGAAMVQFGEAALVQSTLMQSLLNALGSLNPGAGIAISLAMIAIGEALQAAASAAFGGGSASRGGTAGTSGGPETINIALPGGAGEGGAPIPGAQAPAVPPGAPPVGIPPTGSLGSAFSGIIPQPNVAVPAPGSLSTQAMPPIQIVTLGTWSPQMQRDAMREIRLAMRRGL